MTKFTKTTKNRRLKVWFILIYKTKEVQFLEKRKNEKNKTKKKELKKKLKRKHLSVHTKNKKNIKKING